jgi:hypothetical protein
MADGGAEGNLCIAAGLRWASGMAFGNKLGGSWA